MDVLRTKISDWTCLFPLGSVASVFEAPAPEEGVVRWNGGEHAVVDLAGRWTGEPPEGTCYYLELLCSTPPSAVRVSSLEGVQRLPEGSGISLSPWWFAPGQDVFSLAFPERGDLLLLVDPSALLHQPKGDN